MLRHNGVARENFKGDSDFEERDGVVNHGHVLEAFLGPFQLCEKPFKAVPPAGIEGHMEKVAVLVLNFNVWLRRGAEVKGLGRSHDVEALASFFVDI